MYNESHYNLNDVNYLKVAKYVAKNITFNEFNDLTHIEQQKLINCANQLHKITQQFNIHNIETGENTMLTDFELELFINIEEPHSGDYTPYFCNTDINDIKEYLLELGYKLT